MEDILLKTKLRIYGENRLALVGEHKKGGNMDGFFSKETEG
jgi:hypothetical protein